MGWWTRRAAALQQSVSGDESKVHDYTDDESRQATIHTRQDITMVGSLLDSANVQLSVIRWSLGLLVLIGLFGVWARLKALHYI